MALISFRSRRRMKSSSCSSYHSPRLKSRQSSHTKIQPAEESTFAWLHSRTNAVALVVNIAFIYCLLGLIGVAGEDDSLVAVGVRQHQHSSLLRSNSEPVDLKLLEQLEIYLPLQIGATTESYSSSLSDFQPEDDENELNNTFKIEDSDSNLISRKMNGSRPREFRVSEDEDAGDEIIRINHQSTSLQNHNYNLSQSVRNKHGEGNKSRTTIVPKSLPNSAIIKSDANSTYSSKDNESAAADDQNRELITLNKPTTTTAAESLEEPENNEILETDPTMTISPISLNCSKTRTELHWTNDTTQALPRKRAMVNSGSESASELSDNKKLHEITLIKSVPISATFASSVTSRRPKRSVVHLYDMVVCSTGCNPLAYKGYGCYCGFLGSGLIVDGIDKCCAKHDWCYHHAKCPPLLTYFVPYYWTCNDGRPKCVNDYRGWKGICGAHLCECDRQFAECLRKYPCPRGRAVCLSSPFRNPVNNYHYNYNYIEDPEIHYYYS